MPLALVDGNERVDLIHPVFRARLEALAADPRMKGQLAIESAARTLEEQRMLYAAFLSGTGNTAANPDRTIAPAAYGLAIAQGSWHMVQPDGFAYAVDVATFRLSPDVYAALPAVAAEYRLQQTVLKTGVGLPPSAPPPDPCAFAAAGDVHEWWHLQCPLDEDPLEWVPDEEDDMTPEQAKKLDDLLEAQKVLLARTDLLLDHLEGRVVQAPGALPRTDPPLRRIVESIANTVGAKVPK
jgi:hypothetical protein